MKGSLFFLLFLFHLEIVAQNLVPNASFENHADIDCLHCYLEKTSFNKMLVDWHDVGGNVIVCDQAYKKKDRELNSVVCQLNEVSPFDGKTMVELSYNSACDSYDFLERGCSDYLGTSLKTKLEIGHKYRVSFWINIYKSENPSFINFIGFNLYSNKVKNTQNKLFINSSFKIDRRLLNNWYQVSWVVQPTCELDYLLIGVFKDEARPPTSNVFNHNIFYIDKVEIVEVDEIKFAQKVIRFCKEEKEIDVEEVSSGNPVTKCFFESGKFNLSSIAKIRLDTLAAFIKANPNTTFLISGHTDSNGSNHIWLSKKRIESVLNYFKEQYNIPKVRFATIPKGKTQPNGDNASVQGRAKNRKVEISVTQFDLDKMIYRNILKQIEQNDLKLAYQTLQIWLKLSKQSSKLPMLFDPRINVLKQGMKWNIVIDKVRNSYKIFGDNKNIAFSLDSLWAEDQKCRTLHKSIKNLPAFKYELDKNNKIFKILNNSLLSINYNQNPNECPCENDYFLKSEDQLNIKRLKSLINIDYISESKYGERAFRAIFLVIQHCDDSKYKKEFLKILEKLCIKGESKWIYYALLYDRILVSENLPQRFGTQYRFSNGKNHLLPLQNRDSVNYWRDIIGLDKIQL